MKRSISSARAAAEIIERIRAPSDIQGAVEKITEVLGVAHFAYHATSAGELTKNGPLIATTYDDRWVKRYVSQDYQQIDPVVVASLRAWRPVDWRGLDFASPIKGRLLAEAKEFDISTQGVTIPVHGPGGEHALVSVNAAASEKAWGCYIDEMRRDLLLTAYFLHNKIRSLSDDAEDGALVALSVREFEVLHWLARGKTFEEVADILHISRRTVRAHIDGARRKLNAVNATHAVAKALSFGLIAPLSER